MKTNNFSLALQLFTFFFAIYVLTSSFISMSLFDVSIMRLEVAKSIFERFDLDVPAGKGVVGIDGRDYSWFGIGSVLLSFPLYALAKIASIHPVVLLGILNPLFSAATAVLVCFFCISAGYSRKASAFTSFLYGLCTMAWYYSKDPGDHSFETFLILFATFSMYRFTISKKISRILLSGLALGVASLIRPTSFLFVFPLMLMLTASSVKERGFSQSYKVIARGAVTLFFCLLPFLSLFLWYNSYRFGSVFESGYSLIANRAGVKLFSDTSFGTGLLGLLVSPGKGFFFYSPIALLFFVCFKSFWRKHQELGICFISTIIIYVLFFAKYLYWHGDWAWGPRFLFVLTPFLMIPIADFFESELWIKSKSVRNATTVLILISLLIQVISVSVFTYRYFWFIEAEKNVKFTVDKGPGAPPVKEPVTATYFDWKLSPILVQGETLCRIISDMKTADKIDFSADKLSKNGLNELLNMNCLDFWWHYIYYLGGSWIILLIVPLLLLIAIASAHKVYHNVSAFPDIVKNSPDLQKR